MRRQFIYKRVAYLLYNQGLKLTFHSPANLPAKFLSYRPFVTSTSQKNLNKKNKLEAVYTGRDKATVANHFVSVLRVCDIDKKKSQYFLGFYR